MLIAYLDETGHSSDSDFVGVAGILASQEAWRGFDDQWTRVLADYAVPTLHMRELAHFRGQYVGWTEDKRRAFLGQALALIQDLSGVVLGSMLPMDLWSRTLTARQRKALVDPYLPCLREALTSIAVIATLRATGAQVVIAEATEFSYKAGQLWKAAHQNRAFSAVIESQCVFGNPPMHPGLQAADLVAYEFLKAARAQARGLEPKRWPFQQLVKGEHRLHLIDEAYLRLKVPSDEVLKRVPGFEDP